LSNHTMLAHDSFGIHTRIQSRKLLSQLD
jgi:hypothetical protein